MVVTIKDVAKEANVSVATVSRVLNNAPSVSKASKEKVNEVIKRLGYSPNVMGRNLRKSKSNIILAIMPTFVTTFYAEIIKGMQSEAGEKGYDIIICMSNSNLATEMRLLNMLFNRTVDAAVMLGTELDAEKLNEIAKDYNIALCCERVEGAEVLTVTVDDKEAAYAAVKNLYNRGHTKIAMISTKLKTLSSKDRERGYKQLLSDNGIEFREDYVYRDNYDYGNGALALNTFMKLKDPPTAIFCISDLMAFGVAKQATKLGLSIGDDIAICGFDNIPFASIYTPSITTVAQPCFEIGRVVIEELIYSMENNKKSTRHITLNFDVVKGESVKPPSGNMRLGKK